MKKINNLTLALSTALLSMPGMSYAGGVADITQITCTDCTIAGILTKITTWILGLVGLIAVLYLIYGGFIYITSAGNADKAKQAKATILYAVIGLIVIALALVIVQVIAANLPQVVS